MSTAHYHAPKPITSPLCVDNIPDVLRGLDQFLVWKYEYCPDKSKKWTKPPYSARTGRKADKTNPELWASFDDAVQFYHASNDCEGIGFVFTEADPLCGIDLDDCVSPDGVIADWAMAIIRSLGTYTELSPSGAGLRAVCLGRKPGGSSRKGSVEIYDRNFNYVTITGHKLEGFSSLVEERQAQLNDLYESIWPNSKESIKHGRRPDTNGFGLPPESDIIERIRASRKGTTFNDLFSGNAGDDHSVADLKLCNMLAFWCDRQPAVMDSIFRQSGLMRPKWDERHGAHTYGKMTLVKAIEGTHDTFDWSREKRNSGTQHSGASRLLGDPISNGRTWTEDKKIHVDAYSMDRIIRSVKEATGDWPRVASDALFIHEDKDRIHWITKAAGLFGYLGSKTGRPCQWITHPSAHTKGEVYYEVFRVAIRYAAVEHLPHYPLMENHYYMCEIPPSGNGEYLRKLVDYFNPSSLEDHDLIESLFLTLFWGGAGGTRPAFLITSDDGRGSGKSKLAEFASYLAGGHIDISFGEKSSVIKERLLSPDGLAKRCAMFDNVKTYNLSWDVLEAMITAPVISGKRMYVGESQRPNNLTWIVTLNAAGLSKDMAQRVVTIKLSKPDKYIPTWESDVRNFIDSNRDSIIGDILGKLATDVPPIEARSRWSAWEQSVLARIADPGECQAVILDRQTEIDNESDEAREIEESFTRSLSSLGYAPERDRVFLPSQVLWKLYIDATKDSGTVDRVSKILRQMIREKTIRRLEIPNTNSHGRGLIWVGHLYNGSDRMHTDVESRLDHRNQAETF